MLDFLMISTRSTKRGVIEIYPKFVIKRSKDLMIRGSDFYAIWDEDKSLWSTDEQDALRLIDLELNKYKEDNDPKFDGAVKVLYMWDSENGMIDKWHRYCQKHMRDCYHSLDEKLIFANDVTKKTDYASKTLDYPLENGSTKAYNELIGTLYSEEERTKIEWAIGSIISGDSKKIQKFIVLYGSAGTGKSTVLNIIQQLFDGYYSVFDAKALGSSNNSFALEAFRSNPLVAIQHDGDLSRIEDNTRLNSLVSHELMTVNEKFKSTYSHRFNSFIFMGTNKPVRITDAKSGLIRRLIDVSPTGKKVPPETYNKLVKQISFELGAIAYHCKEVYLNDPGKYDNYIPISMLGASNDFYNFVLDSYNVFKNEDSITLKSAWEMYKTYCTEANVLHPFTKRVFKEELKNYFWSFEERYRDPDNGSRIRSTYIGFRTDKFDDVSVMHDKADNDILELNEEVSIFDDVCSDCPAQYASQKETPLKKWDSVTTTLSDIDTSKLHYVKLPENHIVIDFDIPDANGEKSFEKNLAEASKWPKTYAELSKSGKGIHLHYIYEGDPLKLERVYDDHVEIKVFTGNSSLRRRLSKCNNLPIATINSGLPLKGERNVINFEKFKSEKSLRTLIKRNLNKEIHPGTKPSIDFIYTILEEAYESDLVYDVSDMRGTIFAFAANSTNQSEYCIKMVNKMKFKSKIESENSEKSGELIFYDVEVFPNLFLVNWKTKGKDKQIVRMINPKSSEIEDLIKFNLVGFNCRRYDNHLLYACLLGYDNTQLYKLSQRIISGDKTAFFGEAYNLSYTDVYDYASKKQSLKKWEIELGIHHQELGLPWDKPVEKKMWPKVAEYCDYDVLATEAVFNATEADFIAREILADIAGMTVNDTTNSLTTRIIFGKERHPQNQFSYRDLSEPVTELSRATKKNLKNLGLKIPFDEKSLLPYFPGYKFESGKSIYRDEEVGEGGYVYSEPGMYSNVALLDVASMHPSSAEDEDLFGPEYTPIFSELKAARIAIKHKDFKTAKKMFNGKLAKHLLDEEKASYLAQALKIAINSVYGLTSAKFENPFRDIRNKDNIVAKRGALFMIDLKHAVQDVGYTVAHIKTDSIKIPNADDKIIDFVMEFGRKYGYTFEHEATYDKMCLVNDAVYIAKYKDGKNAGKWTATGTQFQVPYVFKTLFSKEPIEFDDLCETKAVTSALYLDMNEGYKDVSEYEKEASKLKKEYSDGGYLNVDRYEELQKLISEGHNYRFIGKVGRFCPIKAGCGGGLLMREKDGKYYAVSGSKGYRWLESEMVESLNKQDDIDKEYYKSLVDEAVTDISKFGDFEWFISDGN